MRLELWRQGSADDRPTAPIGTCVCAIDGLLGAGRLDFGAVPLEPAEGAEGAAGPATPAAGGAKEGEMSISFALRCSAARRAGSPPTAAVGGQASAADMLQGAAAAEPKRWSMCLHVHNTLTQHSSTQKLQHPALLNLRTQLDDEGASATGSVPEGKNQAALAAEVCADAVQADCEWASELARQTEAVNNARNAAAAARSQAAEALRAARRQRKVTASRLRLAVPHCRAESMHAFLRLPRAIARCTPR